MERLTPKQLADALQILPAELGKQAEVVEDARTNFDQCKHELEVAKAKAYLIYEAEKDRTTPSLKAAVESDPDVIAKMRTVIEAEGQYRQEGIKLKMLEDKFTAARKIATLREVELRNIPE